MDYNSASTHSNPLKPGEQKVVREIQSTPIEFLSSRQHCRFQTPFIQNYDLNFAALVEEK